MIAPKLRSKYYTSIANKKIAEYRNRNTVLPNGKPSSEYAHAYFRPNNAMLVDVLTSSYGGTNFRLNEIVMIRINLKPTESNMYMTKKNAYYCNKDDFIPSDKWIEIEPSIQAMLKKPRWVVNKITDVNLKQEFMAECFIPEKFPLSSFKAICIATEKSVRGKGYNFIAFKDKVERSISKESRLTAKNIEERMDLFFDGFYG